LENVNALAGKLIAKACTAERCKRRGASGIRITFVARRMQERGAREQPPEPLRLPSPLSRLPWDVAQTEFGVQGADFLGVMGKVLLRPTQFEFRGHVVDSKEVASTLPPLVAQSQIPDAAG